MNGLPYYKAYPRDFIEGTVGMSFELKAAYRLVLDLIYMQGGRLRDDARYISGMLGCSTRAWNKYKKELLLQGKIYTENGFISNFRADFELESLRRLQDKQRENAKKPRKNKANTKAMAKPKASHTEPEPDITTSKLVVGALSASSPTEADPPEPPKRRRRGKRISENWTPTPQDYAFASSEGLNPQEINHEADKFRDYWLARSGKDAAKLDWSATWRNWIRSDYRSAARRVKQQRGGDTAGRGSSMAAALDRVVDRIEPRAHPQCGRSELHRTQTYADNPGHGGGGEIIDIGGNVLTSKAFGSF